MGLQYKIIKADIKELDRVVCNRCGKDIPKLHEGGWNQFGEPFSVRHEPSFEDFFQLRHTWGYSSSKDGRRDLAVLCEACYDLVFAGCNLETEWPS